jgi:hypothetical protein
MRNAGWEAGVSLLSSVIPGACNIRRWLGGVASTRALINYIARVGITPDQRCDSRCQPACIQPYCKLSAPTLAVGAKAKRQVERWRVDAFRPALRSLAMGVSLLFSLAPLASQALTRAPASAAPSVRTNRRYHGGTRRRRRSRRIVRRRPGTRDYTLGGRPARSCHARYRAHRCSRRLRRASSRRGC